MQMRILCLHTLKCLPSPPLTNNSEFNKREDFLKGKWESRTQGVIGGWTEVVSLPTPALLAWAVVHTKSFLL